MTEDLCDYIRCYIMNAYHNMEHGDADFGYVQDQLNKALKIIHDLQRVEVIEAVNA